MQLKDKIKSKLPQPVLDLYYARKEKQYLRELKFNYLNICKNKNEKINAVFICQLPSIWNSCRTVYEEALKNPKINAYLIAIPEITNNLDGTISFGNNFSYDFLKKQGYQVINGYENNQLFDPKSLKPDYIFLPRPYDSYLPAEYQSGNLAKYTRVCYITYGFSLTVDCMPTIFNYSFLKNVYLFIPDCESSSEYVAELYKNNKCNWNKIGPTGYPRFDLLNQANQNHIKTFLWTPRWTSDKTSCGTTFFEYIDVMLDFFIAHSDLKLVFRPHPLLFKNFLETGELSKEKYDSIMAKFNSNGNLIFDDPVNDYIKTFNEVDALITDPTSLLPEFFYTGKPIIYCAQPDNFNKTSMHMREGLYYANDWNDISELIINLNKGNDQLQLLRKSAISKLNKFQNIGNIICNYIVDDYFKGIK